MQRSYDEKLLGAVKGNPLFSEMQEGIAKGDILPCLRKGEIHFYEGGARLFRFEVNKVHTHMQYVDKEGNSERALYEDEHTSEVCKQFGAQREHAVQVTTKMSWPLSIRYSQPSP